MAQASKDVSHAQLSWASSWYLRPETYSDALAKIVDAHHALPLARVWGDADHTSSDGQFFTAARNSGEINAKYGPDPGLKIYSFLSGQYGSFHSSVIGATAGEAPYVLDGLMGNAAQFNPLVHYTDTGGVSDHVFALFHLLGLRLAPRLRDFPNRKLACFGKASQWKGLAPIMGKPINDEVILSHWDNEVIRLAASARAGDIKPSAMLKKLGALNLVIAAIVYWNTMYMDKAAQHLLKAGQLADPSLLRHVSPLGWMHINLTGDFVWNSGAAERMNARPLHLSATRKWAS